MSDYQISCPHCGKHLSVQSTGDELEWEVFCLSCSGTVRVSSRGTEDPPAQIQNSSGKEDQSSARVSKLVLIVSGALGLLAIGGFLLSARNQTPNPAPVTSGVSQTPEEEADEILDKPETLVPQKLELKLASEEPEVINDEVTNEIAQLQLVFQGKRSRHCAVATSLTYINLLFDRNFDEQVIPYLANVICPRLETGTAGSKAWRNLQVLGVADDVKFYYETPFFYNDETRRPRPWYRNSNAAPFLAESKTPQDFAKKLVHEVILPGFQSGNSYIVGIQTRKATKNRKGSFHSITLVDLDHDSGEIIVLDPNVRMKGRQKISVDGLINQLQLKTFEHIREDGRWIFFDCSEYSRVRGKRPTGVDLPLSESVNISDSQMTELRSFTTVLEGQMTLADFQKKDLKALAVVDLNEASKEKRETSGIYGLVTWAKILIDQGRPPILFRKSQSSDRIIPFTFVDYEGDYFDREGKVQVVSLEEEGELKEWLTEKEILSLPISLKNPKKESLNEILPVAYLHDPFLAKWPTDQFASLDVPKAPEPVNRSMEEHRTESEDILFHYDFNDASGALLSDRSSKNNNGKLVNFKQVSLGAGKRLGGSGWTVHGALNFDGIDDYVETPVSTQHLVGKSFTMELVVAAHRLGDDDRFLVGSSGEDDHGPGIWGVLRPSIGSWGAQPGALLGRLNGGQPEVFSTIRETTLGDGNWHHLAFVRDLSQKEIRIYLDHKLQLKTPIKRGNIVGNEQIFLGGAQWGRWKNWKGLMAEVRLTADTLGPSRFLPNPNSGESPNPKDIESGEIKIDQIQSARWGTESQHSSGKASDVKTILEGYIVDGILSIKVNAMNLGDPAPRRTKVLKVTYITQPHDGPKNAEGKSGAVLRLP